jgi:hypothetical protein
MKRFISLIIAVALVVACDSGQHVIVTLPELGSTQAWGRISNKPKTNIVAGISTTNSIETYTSSNTPKWFVPNPILPPNKESTLLLDIIKEAADYGHRSCALGYSNAQMHSNIMEQLWYLK